MRVRDRAAILSMLSQERKNGLILSNRSAINTANHQFHK
jgi:hypothetical protein